MTPSEQSESTNRMPRTYPTRSFAPYPHRYSSVSFTPITRPRAAYNYINYLLNEHPDLNSRFIYFCNLCFYIETLEWLTNTMYDNCYEIRAKFNSAASITSPHFPAVPGVLPYLPVFSSLFLRIPLPRSVPPLLCYFPRASLLSLLQPFKLVPLIDFFTTTSASYSSLVITQLTH